ncbi:MAG: 30S ribosomal protein S24e [Candidatus Thermoplasmatota archaeon]|nr:30S ribosomal protein S24e [Candidatus Thermoplasmatota archaeon]
MQFEIKDQRENPLLKRQEVEFLLHHPGENTPSREQVREMVASHLNGKKNNVVVDHLKSEFGRATTAGYAKLYESQEAAKNAEPKHLLVRNNIGGGDA